MSEIINLLREDIDQVDEFQLETMMETGPEVLGGLKKTCNDYEKENERAWR